MTLELGGILDPQLQRNFQAVEQRLIDTGGESIGIRFGVDQVNAGVTGSITHGLGRVPVSIQVTPNNAAGTSTPLVVTASDATTISVKNTSATNTNVYWLVLG